MALPERASDPRGAAIAFFTATFVSALVAAISIVRHQPPSPVGTDAPLSEFSAVRAHERFARLYAENAPHPTGTAAQKRMRERIVGELSRMGYAPTVQETFVCSRDATCALVSNVLAELPGSGQGKSVLLAAHYDSVGAGPGASDDGMGVAAILEVARILKSESPRKNSVIFLIDDGEEGGLLGAEAFASKHPWARRVGAVVNLEARGTSGASLLFETSDDNAWLIGLAAAALPHPITSSVFYTIYKWLPNDTDLTVFKAHGLAGVNFACIGSVSHYHTPLDNLENASVATLQHHGENALAMARSLASSDLDHPHRGNAVFFDLFGSAVLRWPEKATTPLALLALLFVVSATAIRARRGQLSLFSIRWGFLAGIGMLLLPVALGLLALRLLSAIGALPTQWTAHPLAWIAALWLLSLAGVAGAADSCAGRAQPHGLWAGVWFLQALLALALAILAPGLSFVFLVPVLAAGILGAVEARWAAVLAAVLSAFFWLPMAWTLYDGLGTHGTAVIAAMVAFFASALAPSFVATAGGLRRNIVRGLCVAAVVALAGAALARPFSSDSPQRVPFLWYEDGDAGSSRWLVSPESHILPRQLELAAPFAKLRETSFPWIEGPFFAAPAVAAKADPPDWIVLQESTDAGHHVLRARAVSRRGAPTVALGFSPGSAPLSIRIGGELLPELYPRLAKKLAGWRVYSCLTVPAEGIEIELARSEGPPIEFLLAD
ncbi:MAG TPA: M20/M25/M40 family metallo-hydrolase, partial [Thermoanaerobaculia bacterium]|nr:M20/M25/M40 family metallo-hydrolase [Thermoanaerobaculia bacterium]